MSKEKGKFWERPFGKFLKEKMPKALGGAVKIGGEALGIEALENLGDWIDGENELTPEEKTQAHQLRLAEIDYQKAYEQEVTKRWQSDNESDSWLTKNIRPLALAVVLFLVMWIIIHATYGKTINEFVYREFMFFATSVVGGFFVLRESGKFIKRQFGKKH